MNEESLSALLDGECSPAELDRLLRRLDHDPSLRERFARLSRAQALRRGLLGRPVPDDFADRVLAALPVRPDRAGGRFHYWRPMAALAAAAGFGALAVLVLRPAPVAYEAGPAIAAGAGATVPMAVSPASAVPEDRDFARLDRENARQLRNYLMAYSQSRAQQGMGGTLGYARYAAYTEDDAGGGSEPARTGQESAR